MKDKLNQEIQELEKELVILSKQAKVPFKNKNKIKKEYLSALNKLQDKKHGLKKLKKKKRTSPKK